MRQHGIKIQNHLHFNDDTRVTRKYYVIYKGHIEGDDAIPEGVIEAPIDIETQDLILISDICTY